jgi:predicted nucleic acid-binding protein
VRFLDTNILLYAISKDPAERRKTETALSLLASGTDELGLSVQVLQEFFVQATSQSRRGALPRGLAAEYLDHWQEFTVQENTVALFRAAVLASGRFGLSYWDASIIEAARMLGCRIVLSEDLQHGGSYGGVRVQNPFQGV